MVGNGEAYFTSIKKNKFENQLKHLPSYLEEVKCAKMKIFITWALKEIY